MRFPKQGFCLKLGFCLWLAHGFSTHLASAEQATYWTPADPPRSHYVIDARIDLSKPVLEGKETIEFKNTSRGRIDVIALNWSIGPASFLSVSCLGKPLEPVNPDNAKMLPPPVFYRLAQPLGPGKKIRLAVEFRRSLPPGSAPLVNSRWYPSLKWDDLPVHDSYSVKIDVPQGYTLAASGRLNSKTGRYENAGARTFGIFLAKDVKTESREVEGVLVTTISTEKGAKAAAICLDTAVDVIKFAKAWLGFYPFQFLTIIPGGSGRWGGYPVATGIVAIHGQETYKEGESTLWWRWITAHEIGHEYWSEWVLDPDDPAWLWIAMGIALDTEYLTSQKIDPERRAKWMGNFLNGLRMYYDMTVDISPARVEKIQYDHNNTVIHSKCPSIIFALDSVLGRPMFEKIYKRCLAEYAGKRLGWNEFQRVCEQETGQSLAWFFDQWVRSNSYLCYRIDAQESKPDGSGYVSTIKVRRLGTMKMPVPVKAAFEDGTAEIKVTERNFDTDLLIFRSKAKLKEAVLDPEKKLAMLDEPLAKISSQAAEALALGWGDDRSPAVYRAIKDQNIRLSEIWYRLGTGLYGLEQFAESLDCFEKVAALEKAGLEKFAALGWLGLLKDLQGKRKEAVANYREALKFDTGESMRHDQFGFKMDKSWLEERLKKPFSQQLLFEVPAKPTVEDLTELVGRLPWSKAGRTPFVIYEKTRSLNIPEYGFWLKLGLLLFDSGFYPEAFASFEKSFTLGPSEFNKFTALVWMGHLMDLQGKREKAVEYYRAALKHDTGLSMTHSQFKMLIDRAWVEERLKTPFTWKK